MSNPLVSLMLPADVPMLPDPAGHARAAGRESAHQYLTIAVAHPSHPQYLRLRQAFESFKVGETPALFKKLGVDARVDAKVPGGESFPDGTKWSDLTLAVRDSRGNPFEMVLTQGRKSPLQPVTQTLEVRGGGVLTSELLNVIAEKLRTANF
ncbi:MAG: hypothetical protein ACAI38_02055 [Myxococcota bacterium]|nr:hypothetical protein [Myxococcota bacterium]